jgi:hypothetical protein
MRMRAVGSKEMEDRVGDAYFAEQGETARSPLAEMVEKGLIQPAAAAVGTPPRVPVTSLGELLEALQQDRNDR